MIFKKKFIQRKVLDSQKKEYEKKPLKNVVSFKINDREKKILEKLTKYTSKSVSDIMREALETWKSRRAKICLDE